MPVVVLLAAVGLQLLLADEGMQRRSNGPTSATVLTGSDLSRCSSRAATSDPRTLSKAGVRSAEKWLNNLIRDARQRSPTFAELALAIEAQRTIVYVEPRHELQAGLVGAVPKEIFHAPDGTRYARIWLLQGRPPDEMIRTIGHELQHVLEHVQPELDATTSRDRPKGTRWQDPLTGLWIVETEAARHVSEAIHRELLESGCKSESAPRPR